MRATKSSGDRKRMRKETVEECATLQILELRPFLAEGAIGTLRVKAPGGRTLALEFRVERAKDDLWLLVEESDGRSDGTAIRLSRCPMRFGGERWWFHCPIVRPEPCGIRTGRLYWSSRSSGIGCRRCHDLTYASTRAAQRGHRQSEAIDRLVRRFTEQILTDSPELQRRGG